MHTASAFADSGNIKKGNILRPAEDIAECRCCLE